MQTGIAVIGTIFVDYKGFARAGYQPNGRNLGRVAVTPGGVARNVAVNMRCLGMDTWLVSTLNQDGECLLLKNRLSGYGIRLDCLATVASGGIGAWLAIIGQGGDLLGSVSHMPDVSVMEAAIIPALPAVFPKVEGVALEVDLSEKIARAVFAEAAAKNVKIYALPGNLSIIGKNYGFFRNMECFICNEVEAGALMRKDIGEPEKMLPEAIAFAREQKLKNFVVTLGEKGAVYIDSQGRSGFQGIYPAAAVDSTGAGDAFFSAAVAALLRGETLAGAVDCGARVASLVIGSGESDCSGLNIQAGSRPFKPRGALPAGDGPPRPEGGGAGQD
ncbi:MAG: carbohydrate kinase family protein [Acidaminococcales bacterium]|jgi:pseudouridine kinase|nr:carbohydrate kinase family protein [Acidaminococcales bacterium]